jgi:hypothetical protein
MSAVGGGGVFVSYRREDGSGTAGRIADRLVGAFGADRVFIDVDKIKPGMDYVEALTRAVESCEVLVAIIGRRWLTVRNKDGRRLDDPRDWVRVEVGTALARGIRVIPVLIGGAAMPAQEKLPDDLAGLVRLNALRVRHESFHPDATQLVTAIEQGLAAAPHAAGTVAPANGAPTRPARPARSRTVSPRSRSQAKARQSDPDRVARLFDEAERIANAITDMGDKAEALSCVAAAATAVDPDRATRLLDMAERVVDRLKKYDRKSAAQRVARAMATADPDRAERLAYTIRDEYYRKPMLGYVAAAVAAANPERAEHLVPAIDDGSELEPALRAMAITDPDRAERVANTLTSSHDKERALVGVVAGLAVADPDRAARIADTIKDAARRASALSCVAAAVAATDLDRASRLFDQAELIARSDIWGKYSKGTGLHGVVAAMATVNPTRAELIAITIAYKPEKERALHDLAVAVAATDPDNAERIAKTIKEGPVRAETKRDVATVIAAADPDRAERIANSIAIKSWSESGKIVKAAALANIARTILLS